MGKIDLKKKANQIRSEIIDVAIRNQAGHIAPSLSCVDILVALYYSVMSYKADDLLWEERDRFIFSKAHGCYALYAILADKGILPQKEWSKFYTSESTLSGCIERNPEYGLEAGCGSLGHGLPIAVGVAFAAKLQNKRFHTFCLMGDGELQEGTTWEALQFAMKHGLHNLIIIVDSNRIQAMDFIINILNKKERDEINKFRGFGLSPEICPGHDANKLARCLKSAQLSSAHNPRVIIAETIKGFGLKCMENVPKFHFRIPTDEEIRIGRSYEYCA